MNQLGVRPPRPLAHRRPTFATSVQAMRRALADTRPPQGRADAERDLERPLHGERRWAFSAGPARAASDTRP